MPVLSPSWHDVRGELPYNGCVRSRWLVVALAVAGCDSIWRLDTVALPIDASADAAPDAAPPCTSFGPWSAPTIIAATNSSVPEESPALSPDGRVVVFQRKTVSGDWDLAYALREGNDFTNAQTVPGLNTSDDDEEPFWSADGNTLYFIRSTGQHPGTAVMEAAYASGQFDTPVPSMDFTQFAYIERPNIAPSSLELAYYNDTVANLYVAIRPSPTGRWTPGTSPLAISSSVADFNPVFVGDGNTLYFTSRRAPGPDGSANPTGQRFIWQATRSDSQHPFGNVTGVDTSGVMEVDGATVSRDGTLMLFTGYPNSQEDIYMMTRQCLGT